MNDPDNFRSRPTLKEENSFSRRTKNKIKHGQNDDAIFPGREELMQPLEDEDGNPQNLM